MFVTIVIHIQYELRIVRNDNNSTNQIKCVIIMEVNSFSVHHLCAHHKLYI